MHDPNFQLVPEKASRRESGRGRTMARLGWIAALMLLLVLGALYGPLLWEQATITAEPPAALLSSSTGAPVAQSPVSLLDDQEALADLYAEVAPSVVNIQVTTSSDSFALPGFDLPEGQEPPLLQSQGSGFIYEMDGHIVTNNHVVEDAESVLVIFSNGYWADAEVVATDPQADLAVIRVTPPEEMEWRPLPLEEPDSLRVGHTVIAIGNPFGLDGTMTTGIVSALGRGVPVGDFGTSRYTLPDVVQTDAAINPGNSGGPLLDLNGRVVGVNFAIRSQVRANAGVGFAIPVSIVHRVVPALIEEGVYRYAYLGLTGSSISAALAEVLELPANRLGVYVATVIPGGPSAEAGIQGGTETVTDTSGFEFQRGGDIITAIDDTEVRRFEDLVSYLVLRSEPGQRVTLTVLRGDEELQIPVVLGERPSSSAPSTQSLPDDDGINAREAIDIATEAAESSGMLSSEILEKLVTPDSQDGVDVWVVELTTADETVVVIVDAVTGEVLGMGEP